MPFVLSAIPIFVVAAASAICAKGQNKYKRPSILYDAFLGHAVVIGAHAW